MWVRLKDPAMSKYMSEGVNEKVHYFLGNWYKEGDTTHKNLTEDYPVFSAVKQ